MTSLIAIGLVVVTLAGLATTVTLEGRIASLKEQISRLEGRLAMIDAGTRTDAMPANGRQQGRAISPMARTAIEQNLHTRGAPPSRRPQALLVLGITSPHSIVVRGLDQHIQWTGAESPRMIMGLRPANF